MLMTGNMSIVVFTWIQIRRSFPRSVYNSFQLWGRFFVIGNFHTVTRSNMNNVVGAFWVEKPLQFCIYCMTRRYGPLLLYTKLFAIILCVSQYFSSAAAVSEPSKPYRFVNKQQTQFSMLLSMLFICVFVCVWDVLIFHRSAQVHERERCRVPLRAERAGCSDLNTTNVLYIVHKLYDSDRKTRTAKKRKQNKTHE